MERLISSATVGSRTAVPLRPLPGLRSRAFGPPRVAPAPLLGLRGFKPIFASLSTKQQRVAEVSHCKSPCLFEGEGLEARPVVTLAEGRELGRSTAQKVVRSAVIAFLSAILLTIVQPIVPPPSYATVQAAAKSGGQLLQTGLLASAWTGFFAGCLHTLSGPDHLAALAPLSIGRTKTQSAIMGALWGCGHDAGQLIFGLLFLLLKDRLHIEIIRTWGTRVVGLTLLFIGAMGIREASEVPTPCVALENGECVVDHIEPVSTGKKRIGFATFATGVIHGLQPDALLMVLPALALPSRTAGAAFLMMFLLGTVFSMGSYTAFIASCTQALKERVPRITEKLTWVASLVAISMGLGIIISEFFGFSLY